MQNFKVRFKIVNAYNGREFEVSTKVGTDWGESAAVALAWDYIGLPENTKKFRVCDVIAEEIK